MPGCGTHTAPSPIVLAIDSYESIYVRRALPKGFSQFSGKGSICMPRTPERTANTGEVGKLTPVMA